MARRNERFLRKCTFNPSLQRVSVDEDVISIVREVIFLEAHMSKMVLSLLLSIALSGCGNSGDGNDDTGGSDNNDGNNNNDGNGVCVPNGGDGRFTAKLSGEITDDITWSDADVVCGGIFASSAGGDNSMSFEGDSSGNTLTFTLTFKGGDMVLGDEITNAAAKAAIIVNSEQVYDSSGFDDCVLSLSNSNLDDENNGVKLYAYDGTISCSGSLDQIGGSGQINLEEVSFRGVLGGT